MPRFFPGKIYVLPFVLLYLFAYTGTAQHMVGSDSLFRAKRLERVSFGFCLGGSNFLLKLKEADIYRAAAGYQDSVKRVSARGTLGLMVGLVIDLRMYCNLYLKLNPSILFNNYVVYYDRMNGRTDLMASQNSFLELPVHIGYKFGNKKLVPVLSAGGNFRFDYTRSQNEYAHTKCWSLDIAVALEKKIGGMTVVPEIRYALALSDVWMNRRMEIPRLIDRMRLNTIYFLITFKG